MMYINILSNVLLMKYLYENLFYRFNVIQASSGITDMGSMLGHLSIATLVSFVVIFLCLIRGIKSVGKVNYN